MKTSTKLLYACIAAIALAGYAAYENNTIEFTRYLLRPDGFEDCAGLRICHLSDIHVKTSPKNYTQLIKKTSKTRPDAIVISGDLIDSRVSDINAAVSLCETLCCIAPVYYVTGNHEERLPAGLYFKAINGLKSAGVHVLEDSAEVLEVNGKVVNIIGAFDREEPDFEGIKKLVRKDLPNILVIHRPQFAEMYASAGVGISFCGHAHGGQVRLPFLGGVIAPDQYFWPEYYDGVHTFGSGGFSTVISRGIGNSILLLRINNRPEIVIVDIAK